MADLTFVGTGEAFDPALPNTSLLYRGSKTLLLDCGFSIPHAFWRISRDADLLDAIYITHLHADHSFGLPALLLWMREEGRSRPLELVGGPGVEAWLKKLLELGYPGSYQPAKCYPIVARELSEGGCLDLDGLELRNAPSEHSVRNLSVRIDDRGKSVCYSGDGAPSAATRRLYRGAEVLVHECYSGGEPTPGHATVQQILELADGCSVAKLCLLHVSRGQKQSVRDVVAGWSGRAQVLFPAPGDKIEIGERQELG
jgi:ribonuclease BN (tRNA processing enzyme)